MLKGYKAFNKDWTCRDMQYTCPGKFELDLVPKVCVRGMHFCKNLHEVFQYYEKNDNPRIAEVIAYGDIDEGKDKCCTNKLEIVRELSQEEIVYLCNFGFRNKGYFNTGCSNSGDYNTGNDNDGCDNTGNNNHGNSNTGTFNNGNNNVGNYNYGNLNVGEHNSGNYNIGDWNFSSYNTGCFCTEDMTDKNTIQMFNKPSTWTLYKWRTSWARNMMNRFSLTNVEKSQQEWDKLNEWEKQQIFDLPNFDPDIFEKCTGIKITEKYETKEQINNECNVYDKISDIFIHLCSVAGADEESIKLLETCRKICIELLDHRGEYT